MVDVATFIYSKHLIICINSDLNTMIQLGGNIELEGFEAAEPGKLVVIKKIVGSYARQISDSQKDFEKLSVILSRKDDVFELKAAVIIGGKETSQQIVDKNLFYGLDKALSELLNAIKG